MTYRHYIICRFNVRNGIASVKDERWRDSAWILERLALMGRYFLPSLAVQSCRDFVPLVVFDADGISSLQARDALPEGRFSFHFSGPDWRCEVAGRIEGECRSHGADFAITTRIDTDDALHRDAIGVIQHNFVQHSPTMTDLYYDFPTGYVANEYGLKNGISNSVREFCYHAWPGRVSMFCTRIERVTPGRLIGTVYEHNHSEIRKHAPVYNLCNEEPMWLQMVHGSNVVTKNLRGIPRPEVTAADLARDFGIKLR